MGARLMGYYPIVLDLSGRPCVVIGGGAVAERKVEALRAAGALVTIISPALTTELERLASAGQVRHVARPYRAGDLTGHRLALVATDDGAVNAAVAQEGRERGVWVNAADDPAHCDFLLPSILRRGDLVVAVSTSGTAPGLARAIREELEASVPAEYGPLVRMAAEVRAELRAAGRTLDAAAWKAALHGNIRRLVVDDRLDEAKAALAGTTRREQAGEALSDDQERACA
jgi:precorrin-2 dehydrogenase/sirohydrochlorin ferrochelatase